MKNMRFVSLFCAASMALTSLAFAGGSAVHDRVGGTRLHHLHCNTGLIGVGYNLVVETIAGVAPWYSVKSCTLLRGIPGSEPRAIPLINNMTDDEAFPVVLASENGEFQAVVQPSGESATLKFGNGAYECKPSH